MGRKLKRQCRLSTSTWWLRLAGVSGASSYWNDLLHCPFWQLRTLLAGGGGSDFRFFIFGSVRFDGDDVRSWWRVWRAYNTSEWNELCANAPYRIEQKMRLQFPFGDCNGAERRISILHRGGMEISGMPYRFRFAESRDDYVNFVCALRSQPSAEFVFS